MQNATAAVIPFVRLDASAIKALSSVGRAEYMQGANVAMQEAAKNGSALIGHIFYTASIEYGTDEFTRVLCLDTVPEEFHAYAKSFWAPFKRAYAAGKAERALTHFSALAKEYPAAPKDEAKAKAKADAKAAEKAEAAAGEAAEAEAIDDAADAYTALLADNAALASKLAAVTAERDALKAQLATMGAKHPNGVRRAPAPVTATETQSAMAAALLSSGLVGAAAAAVTH